MVAVSKWRPRLRRHGPPGDRPLPSRGRAARPPGQLAWHLSSASGPGSLTRKLDIAGPNPPHRVSPKPVWVDCKAPTLRNGNSRLRITSESPSANPADPHRIEQALVSIEYSQPLRSLPACQIKDSQFTRLPSQIDHSLILRS